MPTGWRPADVAEKHPIEVIEDVYTQEKYNPKASLLLKAWSYFQLIVTLLLAIYLFNNLGNISIYQSVFYGGFIFLTVFAYTTLMDRKKTAIWWELTKAFVGLGTIYILGDWFLISNFIPNGKLIVAGYFILSFLVVFGFAFWDIRKDESTVSAKIA